MEAVSAASAILAIATCAAQTSTKVAEAINTIKHAKKEARRVQSELAIFASLLRLFSSTIKKADSFGAQVAQEDKLDAEMINQSESIMDEMCGLLGSFGFLHEGDAPFFHETVARLRWYLYKGEMKSLYCELDSIKASLNLFVSLINLNEMMKDMDGSIDEEEYRALKEQVLALRKALKIAQNEALKHQRRPDHFYRQGSGATPVESIVLNLTSEELKRCKGLRRQSRRAALRPSPSPERHPATRSPSLVPPPTSPGTLVVEERMDNLYPQTLRPRRPRTDAEIRGPSRQSPESEQSQQSSILPEGQHEVTEEPEIARSRTIRAVSVPGPPQPQDVEVRNRRGTDDLDDIPAVNRENCGFPVKSPSAEFEQVYHDAGPEDAPQVREYTRKKRSKDDFDGGSS